MNKADEKERAEFYLRVSKILQEASIKMGLRNALGYVFTSEEQKAMSDIQQIFFPEQETTMDVNYTVLNKASCILIDVWAGVPVAYLPPINKLRIAEHSAKQLRNQPVHFGERRSE